MNGKPPRKPTGHTIVDHNIRVSLKLTIDEYVMADIIYRYNQTHKIGGVTYRRYYSECGFQPLEVQVIMHQLKQKGILVWDGKRQRTTTSLIWNKFFDSDELFEQLWKINSRGNKQEARDNFNKSKLLVPFNVLLEKLQEYVDSKNDPQFIMKLSNWLDPKKKHWEDEIAVTFKNSKNDNSTPVNLFT